MHPSHLAAVELDGVFDQFSNTQISDHGGDVLQDLLYDAGIRSHRCDAQGEQVPGVLVIHLRDSDLEARSDAVAGGGQVW